MPEKPFTSNTVVDSLRTFELGMHSGVAVDLLPKNQLSFATNCTVRGSFVTHRPPVRKIEITFESAAVQTAFETGLFQCAAHYQPDTGNRTLVAAISGKLYNCIIGVGATAAVSDITGGFPQNAAATQHWMWQAEKWLIWNDGLTAPVFWDNAATVRSNFGAVTNFTTTTNAAWTTPAVGASANFTVISTANFVVGDVVNFAGLALLGWFVVTDIVNPTTVTLYNSGGGSTGWSGGVGVTLAWQHATGPQLPTGRMGAYIMGRNWICLPDGKQFVASDLLGNSSGTIAENYRDAVLNVTENAQLAYGGTFSVPGSIGDIRAIIGAAVLDVSMGQGPVQILTPNAVFTCNASPDRATWQQTTNPIVTQALISYGGLGQFSTVTVNGDTFFRSPDGWRSLVIGRRDFLTWGNTPISLEVDRIIAEDDKELLEFSSGAVFDNRFLATAHPIQIADHGTYHPALTALNFDQLASLRGKAPSVYDGMWTGLNILQLVKGTFFGVERLFAFTLETVTNKIELWEFQNTGDAIYDNDGTNDVPIIWAFESPKVFQPQDLRSRPFLRLLDGEMMIDQLEGTVEFQVYYRPDDYPCWVPWFSWTECSKDTSTQPQFRPRMGFGEPNSRDCDPSTNRPLREGYDFQMKIIVRGHCRVLGMRFKAVTIPEPTFAKPNCEVCPT